MPKKILLYWWSERFIQKRDYENYGDLIGPYLVEKISGQPVKWVRASKPGIKNYFKPIYATVGSILSHLGKNTIVWGCGINHREERIISKKLLAVRGPLSRKRALELNLECPPSYGDPALLLPVYYKPKVDKQFKIGIIPHIIDYEDVHAQYKEHKHIKVIDFKTNDLEQTTDAIASCELIISSSLHGVIVSHAYGIPAVQVKFSDRIHGDGVKYHDYYLSVGMDVYEPELLNGVLEETALVTRIMQHACHLPHSAKISTLQQELLAVCPFKKTV